MSVATRARQPTLIGRRLVGRSHVTSFSRTCRRRSATGGYGLSNYKVENAREFLSERRFDAYCAVADGPLRRYNTPTDRPRRSGAPDVRSRPVYLARAGAAAQSLAFLAVAVIYLAPIVPLMPFEEDGLRRAYGDQYVGYSRRVRRRVPFVY